MEQGLDYLIICIARKLVFFSKSHSRLCHHETVGKQRISVLVPDAVIGIEQTFDISAEQFGLIHEILDKQEYLHHVAHLLASHCSYCIHRTTDKDAQWSGNEKPVLDQRTCLIAERLFIQAQQVSREIHVEFLLVIPRRHVHDAVVLAISVVIEIAIGVIEECGFAVFLQ